MSGGVAEIQARIAEIETRFRPAVAPGNSVAFAKTLNAVLGAPENSAVPTTFSGASTNATGQKVVDIAKQWLGTPYVWGGNDPEKGLDCSGIVQQAYKRVGIQLPRVAADQARMGTAVPSIAQAKPGDLVAFGSPVDHIGIYVGDNKMVVAPKRGDVVKVQEIYRTPTAIRRIVDDTATTSAMSAASSAGSLSGALSSQYNALFAQAGAKHGVSPTLLAAVAKAESNFNAGARSGAGALGLMQIMPGTAKGLGVDPMNPAQAVDGAASMLSGLIKKFGSVDLALAGYNAGPNAVTRFGGIPPYAETQNYVRKINSLIQQGGGL